MSDKDYEGYVQGTFEVLKDYAMEAKKNSEQAVGEKKAYAKGYMSAYHRVITLLQQDAEIYGLTLEDIGLDDIQDSDLI